MSYQVTNLLDDSDIEYLCNTYKSRGHYTVMRYYNLFSMERSDSKLTDDRWLHIKSKLDGYYPKGEGVAYYFLKYIEGSFCALHVDSPKRVNHTSITLLSKSEDLDGGDIVIQKTNFGLRKGVNIPTEEEITSGKISMPLIKDVKPLQVVKQQVGETVWYSGGLSHGVTYVNKGHRLVLISWYKDIK